MIYQVLLQGEINYSDWMSVRRELAISVEQNQLLSRQAKLAKFKIADLKAAFQTKCELFLSL